MALAITISNSDPNPNGTRATMSRGGENGPNQATWRALDKTYTVSLPGGVWSAPPGHQLTFTIQQRETSGTYTLNPNAPLGEQGYEIDPAKLPANGQPTIIVDP